MKYVGALVLCNDVSARDFMFGAPMLQWFKGKGQRTFCPLGPVLYLLDEPDFAQFYELELTLKLNGEVKQQATTDQLIHKPPKTITEISAFANLSVGDCILTGTPGGVLAGHSPKAGLAIVMNLTNDQKRREEICRRTEKVGNVSCSWRQTGALYTFTGWLQLTSARRKTRSLPHKLLTFQSNDHFYDSRLL